jgi:hypothetical protein
MDRAMATKTQDRDAAGSPSTTRELVVSAAGIVCKNPASRDIDAYVDDYLHVTNQSETAFSSVEVSQGGVGMCVKLVGAAAIAFDQRYQIQKTAATPSSPQIYELAASPHPADGLTTNGTIRVGTPQ